MSNCCDPKAPKVVTLIIGGSLVGLIGVEQAFLDVRSLELKDAEAGEKLLELVARRNYIVEGTEREYKAFYLDSQPTFRRERLNKYPL